MHKEGSMYFSSTKWFPVRIFNTSWKHMSGKRMEVADLWSERLCAKALVHLCMCESFELLSLPPCVTRQTKVEDGGGGLLHPPRHVASEGSRGDQHLRRQGEADLCRHKGAPDASDEAMQGNVMPPGTLVLAHFLEDRAPINRHEPRVLTYDIVMHRGVSVEGLPPQKRYSILLEMFKNQRGMITLQWS
ncbi:hypothetical protein GUITHDRAFT_134777 [Guillardia theta CCMP2712]|uniref:Uncharacterized protein n=1 Tax=Guillardia theta (strain CCMP2712) TaxID=905079 RepID=L1JSP7_GUITC|nr:hypothetical protein GUITHDRAFT_134777 [Guillardia theta CCMP2712]EKX51299.1 hypothetical protein GUITHDRAFT_134777 [Guillardia theta CCMP2712]|eukprot:XP_005838279.1 hypothetical protein GUITHDRAFT_134777 [Guillardia theta CCMP2712]